LILNEKAGLLSEVGINVLKTIQCTLFERGDKMAVKMRLKRIGKKKKPFYRIVIADERAPRDGRFIDQVGTYNPLTDPSEIKFDEEKAKEWLKKGVQPTDTVKKLLKISGIIE